MLFGSLSHQPAATDKKWPRDTEAIKTLLLWYWESIFHFHFHFLNFNIKSSLDWGFVSIISLYGCFGSGCGLCIPHLFAVLLLFIHCWCAFTITPVWWWVWCQMLFKKKKIYSCFSHQADKRFVFGSSRMPRSEKSSTVFVFACCRFVLFIPSKCVICNWSGSECAATRVIEKEKTNHDKAHAVTYRLHNHRHQLTFSRLCFRS